MARGSDPDGIPVAKLQGHADYARTRKTPRAQAIAELCAISDRPDLLARAAGIIAGASTQGMCHQPTEMAKARLLVEAGADRAQLAEFIRQGIENAARRRGRFGEPQPAFHAPQELIDSTLAELLEGLDGDELPQ